MMKKEILDIRTYMTILLVVLTLAGQRWSTLYNHQPGAQNLNFIPLTENIELSMR